jgi:hypothetical protein
VSDNPEDNMLVVSFYYSTSTSESAEYGDHADHGFWLPGGWKFSMNDEKICEDILTNPDDYNIKYDGPGDLGHILDTARNLGIGGDNGDGSFYSVDPDVDYTTGEDTSYSMHVKGVTPSTVKRIARLLCK